MFTNCEIENIRMFDDKIFSFNLSDMTVLCGSNGSGKSTIFKTLLLLKQSQCFSRYDEVGAGRLIFNGDNVDLGDYDSYVSYGKIDRNIIISLRIKDSMLDKAYRWLENFAKIETSNVEEEYVDYELDVKFTFNRVTETPNAGRRKGESQRFLRQAAGKLLKSDYVLLLKGVPVLKWHVVGVDVPSREGMSREYFIHLPKNYLEAVGGHRLLETESADEEDFYSIEVTLNGLFPDGLWTRVKSETPDDNESNKIKIPLPPTISTCIGDLIINIENIQHIGPLRTPGKRFYFTREEQSILDSVGEFLPYILRDKKDVMVYGCFPNKNWSVKEIKLIDAINYWLYFFRTGSFGTKTQYKNELMIKTKASVLVNLDLIGKNGKQGFSLADSGFGYSQILPIIVKCLMAEFNNTVIIEQPELHLNPALQVRLGVFLVAMSTSFKQIIIETHSEHIVNTIRVLAAENSTDEIAKNSKIYFIDNELDCPEVYELNVQADGSVPNWPKHFFGEALELSGRLLRARKIVSKKGRDI